MAFDDALSLSHSVCLSVCVSLTLSLSLSVSLSLSLLSLCGGCSMAVPAYRFGVVETDEAAVAKRLHQPARGLSARVYVCARRHVCITCASRVHHVWCM